MASNLNILAICGSLRKASTNMGLLRYARDHAPAGLHIEIADLSAMPFYNQDITEKPAAVKTLLSQIEKADGILFGCAEYNYSMAPPLKNALDWASREPDNKLLNGKPAAIMGSGGGMGSSRAQYHLRQTCVFLNMHPINKPEVFANAFTGAFDANGNLTDEDIQKNIVAQLNVFKAWIEQLKK